MFEVPGAKRLKRSDLLHDDSEDEDLDRPSKQAEREIIAPEFDDHTSYGFEYDFVEQPNSPTITTKYKGDDNVDQESFQFNLFKPKKHAASVSTADKHPKVTEAQANLHRISIRSPTPVEQGPGVFMRPRRSDSYYFIESLPTEKLNSLKAQYAAVALSGTEIMKQSKSNKWPGTFLPWRVIHLPPNKVSDKTGSTTSQSLHLHESLSSSKLRRMRPSKKRRILLRKRLAVRREVIKQNEKSEEAEREKRTRKNREKKVKRKEREKRKKQEAASAVVLNKNDSVSSPDGS